MSKEYDFEKYIWQIQFQHHGLFSLLPDGNITINYLKRVVIVKDIDNREKVVNVRTYEIEDVQFEQLLELSMISKLREFEGKSKDELMDLECGFRDEGCFMIYSYFTHGEPPRTDGALRVFYSGSPFEAILRLVYLIIRE